MYVYNDDGRSLEFRDADDLKTFLLEEYAPALLAKALAEDVEVKGDYLVIVEDHEKMEFITFREYAEVE